MTGNDMELDRNNNMSTTIVREVKKENNDDDYDDNNDYDNLIDCFLLTIKK